MALAFRSSTSAATSVVSSASFTVNAPASVALNDVMLMFVECWANIAVTSTGWTQVRADNDGTTGDVSLTVLRKIATASEPTSYTVSMSPSSAGTASVLAYSGGDTTTPVDVSGTIVADPASGSSTQTIPSVTTTSANDILVLCYSCGSQTQQPTWSTPTSTTVRVANFHSTETGTGNGQAVFDIAQAATGATPTFASTVTFGGTQSAVYGTACTVIALKAGAAAAAAQQQLTMLGVGA